jgi:hypothetical protein
MNNQNTADILLEVPEINFRVEKTNYNLWNGDSEPQLAMYAGTSWPVSTARNFTGSMESFIRNRLKSILNRRKDRIMTLQADIKDLQKEVDKYENIQKVLHEKGVI